MHKHTDAENTKYVILGPAGCALRMRPAGRNRYEGTYFGFITGSYSLIPGHLPPDLVSLH